MSYTIGDIAKMMNVSIHTIRYRDKEGLFPLVKRVNGIRIFEEKDFPWLRMLNCLKNINMPIKKIKEYVDLAVKGDNKKLFIVPDATNCDLYDGGANHDKIPFDKIERFIRDNL